MKVYLILLCFKLWKFLSPFQFTPYQSVSYSLASIPTTVDAASVTILIHLSTDLLWLQNDVRDGNSADPFRMAVRRSVDRGFFKEGSVSCVVCQLIIR